MVESRLRALDVRPGTKIYRARLLVECVCGVRKLILKYNFRRTKSCGCLQQENRTVHGMYRSLTYSSWQSMKARCLNPNTPGYEHYGGRGIRICERWMVFANFYADMGERPEGTEIDRIDCNGNYEPSNCKWSTRSEQMNNTRGNHLITLNDKTLNITQWAAEVGLSRALIYDRLDKGWSEVEAVLIPKWGRKKTWQSQQV